MAKGDSLTLNTFMKGRCERHMREPIHVLKSIQQQTGNKEYRFQRLYRNLYNPEFYLLAYKNIAASQGSMTAGADGTTLDDMSMARIEAIISALKDHSYQPTPARRTYIAKKNGKMRPLGILSTNDRLIQEVIRMMLEAIYEPKYILLNSATHCYLQSKPPFP